MSGRFVVLVVAAVGWLFASVLAFAIVNLFGFFGVGFFGLLLWFICTQVDLQSGGSAGLFSAQAQARQSMSARSVPPGTMSSRWVSGPLVASESLESR